MNPPVQSPVREFVIARTFAANRDRVWRAWTEIDQLEQWFGPKGVTTVAAKREFKPGGIFHYCMKTPDGKEMWGRSVYREIVPPERLVWVNSFSNPEGGVTRHPFSGTWPLEMLTTVTLSETDGKTTVTVEWLPLNATAAELATFDGAREGMKGGWTGTFDQLAAYLAKP